MQTGKIIALWFGLNGSISFIAMGADKRRAVHHQHRIPETTLLLLGLVGGAWGGWLGMFAFRHKTRHLHFRLGFPLMALFHAVLLLWLQKTGVI